MSGSDNRLDRYQLRLPSFEGPLDVLLQLIERDRLEVSSVSLVAVTDGFLDYVATMVDPEPALLADFLGIASRLVLLKTRSLLPRRPLEFVEDEPDDIITQLREYQRAKQLALALREREISGYRSWTHPPTQSHGPVNIRVEAPSLRRLRRALLKAVSRAQREPEIIQLRLQVTIAEMTDRIRRLVGGAAGPIGFRGVVDVGSREELVAGFVALLAMWRRGELVVRQQQQFGDIMVESAEQRFGDD